MLKTYPEAAAANGAAWIDLCDPTPEEMEQAHVASGLRVPTREELDEIQSSSRLRVENGALYLSMTVTAHPELKAPTPSPLGFVLSNKTLVTVRYSELYGFKDVQQQLARGDCLPAASEIFTSLVEDMTDFVADTLEQISRELNEISRRVFERYGGSKTHNVARVSRALKQTLRDLGQRGERLSQIRESLLGLQRIAPFVAERGLDWIGAPMQQRLKTAGSDLISLSDFGVHLTDKVQFLLDAVLGFINTEQNDIFKVLTIVSVVGIPPTLIASMYGMNFHYMPELAWRYGYAYGLGLIVLSIVLPVAWFKWRGWW